jgi:hypothetical protein
VDPEEAEVSIEGRLIGIADDWDGSGGGEVYEFPGPGDYYVRLSLPPKWETAWIKIVVTPDAAADVVEVDTELRKVKKRDD